MCDVMETDVTDWLCSSSVNMSVKQPLYKEYLLKTSVLKIIFPYLHSENNNYISNIFLYSTNSILFKLECTSYSRLRVKFRYI